MHVRCPYESPKLESFVIVLFLCHSPTVVINELGSFIRVLAWLTTDKQLRLLLDVFLDFLGFSLAIGLSLSGALLMRNLETL
jgi:hypothetical protein